MKSIIDYFDVTNYTHLKAWEKLEKTGVWPNDFYENIKDLEFPMNWNLLILGKMAKIYVRNMINAMEGK